MSGLARLGCVLVLAAVVAPGLRAQSASEIEEEYHFRVRRAERDSATALDFVRAAEASRFMRRFEESASYLEWAEAAADQPGDKNTVLRERLNHQLAVGAPVTEMQATFASARAEWGIPLVVVAGWLNAFPELLIGGGYDAMIESLSGDAEDPDRVCDCYAPKAWMHRVAGRMDLSRIYWDSLNTTWSRNTESSNSFDEADLRAQYARNLARAGRIDDATAELALAMAANVSAFESVSILRRRAQTYAELGEVEKAVADLENLLKMPSPVTAHTIANRVTWEPIRRHPAFQALLRSYPIS